MELKELENVKVDGNIKVLRREVWYVNPVNPVGSEQQGQRPAIIVSNDIGNKNSPIVEIVYITTSQKKAKLPTHVNVNNFKLTGIALCENITTVDKSRLVSRITMLTEQQMALIDKAMCISLEITKKPEIRQASINTSQPAVTVIAIPGEDNNHIIKQANEHIKKLVDAGTSLSKVEDELSKIMQANIRLEGIEFDYLTDELKDEIRHKAAEKVEIKKEELENELLSLMEKRKPAIINQDFEDAVQEMIEHAKDEQYSEKAEVKANDEIKDETASSKSLQKAEHDLDFEEVKRLYLEEGYTIAGLCKKFKKSSVTMGAYLKEHGIVRPAGRQKKPR